MVPWSYQQRKRQRGEGSAAAAAVLENNRGMNDRIPRRSRPSTVPSLITSSVALTVQETTNSATAFRLSATNGPESPPVLYNPQQGPCGAFNYFDNEDDEERCRACQAQAMVTDWKQGDRICTECGVVAESHLRDTRPEWKDFHEADDLARGRPSGARSGLVAVDESKYLGGLQPTLLSKHAFGESHSGYGMARIRKRLKATNKRLDSMMEKIHSKALKDARLDRKIRLKRHRQRHVRAEQEDETDGNVRPEFDQLVLLEEEEAHRLHISLYAEKWSLDRAILLHGQPYEQLRSEGTEEERQALEEQLDKTLRKASEELYTAYTMLLQSARDLHLPESVRSEVAHRLVRYVTHKDGFKVPGIASRLNQEALSQPGVSPKERKEAAQQLQEYNRRKQMAGLSAALIYLTARSLGWTRSISEICGTFPEEEDTEASTEKEIQKSPHPAFIKAKHVSRAMKEIKALFPEYARQPTQSSINDRDAWSAADSQSMNHFTEHCLRKLQLPPVADAAIRTLMVKLRRDQITSGKHTGTKLSTLCAGIAYLVCSAGSTMQRLAQQHKEEIHSSQQSSSSNKPDTLKYASCNRQRKKRRIQKTNDNSKTALQPSTVAHDAQNFHVNSAGLGTTAHLKKCGDSSDDDFDNEHDGSVSDNLEEPFDVFSHPAITNEDSSEKQEYELRRMWDAWSEQMSWGRSFGEIEQSCGVSRRVVRDFYKTDLHSRREEILQWLSDAVKSNNEDKGNVNEDSLNDNCSFLQGTPLASILLQKIPTVVPLLSKR